jgi:quercetin dioxygenase-like cupin family protein
LVGINFPKKLHIKPTTHTHTHTYIYIYVMRGRGVEQIGLRDKMI